MIAQNQGIFDVPPKNAVITYNYFCSTTWTEQEKFVQVPTSVASQPKQLPCQFQTTEAIEE